MSHPKQKKITNFMFCERLEAKKNKLILRLNQKNFAE